MEQQATTNRLTQHQEQLLIAMYLSNDSSDAYRLIVRSATANQTAKTLVQMDYIVVASSTKSASVTPKGGEYLMTNGYMEDAETATELGQQLYKQAAAMLNENYDFLNSLIK